MKKTFALLSSAAIAMMFVACTGNKYTKDCKLNNENDSVSYALGYFQGRAFVDMSARLPFDTVDYKLLSNAFAASNISDEYAQMYKDRFDTIDTEIFKYGFMHQLAYGKCKIDEMTADIICRRRFEQVQKRQKAEFDSIASANKQEGLQFLANNAKNDSIVVLESGLQYKVITNGTGEKPKATDRVKVHYTGRLLDGTVFDSSVERGEPATLPLGGVIKGWSEVLQLMPVGSKWVAYIPADLGYGERGAGDNIGPNSVLVFDIELIEIVKE